MNIKKYSSIKLVACIVLLNVFLLSSCEKETSLENSDLGGNELIVGQNCRIKQIVYNDTASNINLGSLAATINILDGIDQITTFDSLGLAITFSSSPIYTNDTVQLNADEYFVVDIITNRIKKLHGLSDPTDILSPQFDADYTYNSSGYLSQKAYSFSGVPVYNVAYTYTGANLTKMEIKDLFSNETVQDAVVDYYSNIAPKNYLYIFPDEETHAEYTQFFNFGKRPTNAVKKLNVKYYNAGVAVDSAVSNFASYRMSRDNYVLDVIMSGDDQPSIPAAKSKLKFSYKCK